MNWLVAWDLPIQSQLCPPVGDLKATPALSSWEEDNCWQSRRSHADKTMENSDLGYCSAFNAADEYLVLSWR